MCLFPPQPRVYDPVRRRWRSTDDLICSPERQQLDFFVRSYLALYYNALVSKSQDLTRALKYDDSVIMNKWTLLKRSSIFEHITSRSFRVDSDESSSLLAFCAWLLALVTVNCCTGTVLSHFDKRRARATTKWKGLFQTNGQVCRRIYRFPDAHVCIIYSIVAHNPMRSESALNLVLVIRVTFLLPHMFNTLRSHYQPFYQRPNETKHDLD